MKKRFSATREARKPVLTEYIRNYRSEKGRFPTMREARDFMGNSSAIDKLLAVIKRELEGKKSMNNVELRRLKGMVSVKQNEFCAQGINPKDAYKRACSEVGLNIGLPGDELNAMLCSLAVQARTKKSDDDVKVVLNQITSLDSLKERSAKVHRLIVSGVSMRAVFQGYFTEYDELIAWPDGYALATGREKHGYTQYFSLSAQGEHTLLNAFGWNFLVDGKPLGSPSDISDGSVLRVVRPVPSPLAESLPQQETKANVPPSVSDKSDEMIRLLNKISIQLDALLNMWS